MMPTLPLEFIRVASIATLTLAACLPVMAQTATAPAPVSPQPAVAATGLGVTPGAANFYQELGGKAGIDAIVAEFVVIMTEDKRINGTFDGVDLDRLRAKLAEQFCAVSGGPCVYTGKSMTESHEDLKINNAQFNASVENLQLALERRGVPSRVQNRLLARLAPTQREIVTK